MVQRSIEFPGAQEGLDDIPGLLGGREVLLGLDGGLVMLNPDVKLRQVAFARLCPLIVEGRRVLYGADTCGSFMLLGSAGP
jgi:hypothetical protein